MQEQRRILDLTIRAGEILLHNGAEAFRVQETMTKIASAYDATNFHAYVLPNGIFASIDNREREVYFTNTRHVPLGPIHLGRVAAVNQLSRDIVAGKYTIDNAWKELDRIIEIPYANKMLQIFWAGICGATFCYIFGGDFFDSIVAFPMGAILYIFLLSVANKKISRIMTHIIGGGLVAACGLILFEFGLGNHMDKMIMGSILPMVPGVAFTNSIRDFFSGDHLSGMSRLIDAVLITFCIAIGVGVVLNIGGYLGMGGAL